MPAPPAKQQVLAARRIGPREREREREKYDPSSKALLPSRCLAACLPTCPVTWLEGCLAIKHPWQWASGALMVFWTGGVGRATNQPHQ